MGNPLAYRPRDDSYGRPGARRSGDRSQLTDLRCTSFGLCICLCSRLTGLILDGLSDPATHRAAFSSLVTRPVDSKEPGSSLRFNGGNCLQRKAFRGPPLVHFGRNRCRRGRSRGSHLMDGTSRGQMAAPLGPGSRSVLEALLRERPPRGILEGLSPARFQRDGGRRLSPA